MMNEFYNKLIGVKLPFLIIELIVTVVHQCML